MDERYKNYQIERVGFNPFGRVMHQLKGRNRRNAHILRILRFDWPVSEIIIERLSSYITDGIQVNQEPVIYLILEKALRKYSESVFFKQPEKYEDPVRMGVFLEAIITETCRAMKIEILDGQGEVWRISAGEPLSLWLTRHPGDLTVSPRPHGNERALRAWLYALMACPNVKTVLRRANYEQAIVAGRMAIGH
jgi:hypothetical protein